MGYKNFQVPKTVYLPCSFVAMTLEEYKNAYGIDLVDELGLVIESGNSIAISTTKLVEYKLVLEPSGNASFPMVAPICDMLSTPQDEGVTNATLALFPLGTDNDVSWAFGLAIDKDSPCTLDNIMVMAIEI